MNARALLPLLLCSCGVFGGNVKKSKAPTPKDAPVLRVATDPMVVLLSGALANEYAPSEKPSELVARLRVHTSDLPDRKRPPVNLALAIDTSGSMEGQAIEDARQAAVALVDELRDGDTLSVTAFSSRAKVLLPTTVIKRRTLASVKKKIATMKARGTTDLANGLSAAISQAHSGRKPDGVSRIVLLSDGVPNDATNIVGLAQNARNAGMTITALGLGQDYDETLLANVAQVSGGVFHYVDDSAKVASVFRDEVLRIEQVVARNAALTVTPGPGVSIVEILGQQPQAVGSHRAMRVHLGDISAGEERDLFVRLTLEAGRDGANVELLDGLLTFQDNIAQAGNLERLVYLAAKSTASASLLEQGRDPEVEEGLKRAEIAAASVKAIAMARTGQLEGAQKILLIAEDDARKEYRRSKDEEIKKQADEMARLRESLPSVAPRPQPVPRRGKSYSGKPAPAPVPVAEDAPAVVRKSHDQAMKTLQGR